MVGTCGVYVGECAGSHSVGRPWKRWIYTMKECLSEEVWILAKHSRIGVNGGGLRAGIHGA